MCPAPRITAAKISPAWSEAPVPETRISRVLRTGSARRSRGVPMTSRPGAQPRACAPLRWAGSGSRARVPRTRRRSGHRVRRGSGPRNPPPSAASVVLASGHRSTVLPRLVRGGSACSAARVGSSTRRLPPPVAKNVPDYRCLKRQSDDDAEHVVTDAHGSGGAHDSHADAARG